MRNAWQARAYSPGRTVKVRLVYQNGTASIFLDGRKVAEKSVIPHGVRDSKQAGTLGATLSGFDAVGEVIGESKKPRGKGRNYEGSVFDLQIHNRVAE